LSGHPAATAQLIVSIRHRADPAPQSPVFRRVPLAEVSTNGNL
jgi:hypothetical protein